MAKVDINYTLENNEKITIKTRGILNDNILIFNDNNVNTKITLSSDSVIIRRENVESINEMYFGKKSSCKYKIKKYNKYVSFDIKLKDLNISDNDIKIIYEINDEKFKFYLHYEVIK